jgi:hypothetical protein
MTAVIGSTPATAPELEELAGALAHASDDAAALLDVFLAEAPLSQRLGLRAMLALARRPGGARLLARVPLAAHAAQSVLSLARYEDPRLGRLLGWDANAVVARGRELRRREGRP